MAPKYDVVLMTQAGPYATSALDKLVKTTANKLWEKGAVLADIKAWGNRELAYRSPATPTTAMGTGNGGRWLLHGRRRRICRIDRACALRSQDPPTRRKPLHSTLLDDASVLLTAHATRHGGLVPH